VEVVQPEVIHLLMVLQYWQPVEVAEPTIQLLEDQVAPLVLPKGLLNMLEVMVQMEEQPGQEEVEGEPEAESAGVETAEEAPAEENGLDDIPARQGTDEG